jgi:succinate dehydrogenase / fumarate reductase membrane anchor subunit
MMALFIVAAAIHMSLGVQMVIEDYIHRDGSKIALLVLNQFFAWIIAATALFALIKIVL